MKTRKLLTICLMATLLIVGASTPAKAGKNADARAAYVLKNLGVSRDIQGKLKPMLQNYLADKKAANKEYDSMKKKLENSINAGTISEKQAEDLLTKKWASAERELTVKRQYEKKFRTVLSAKKTYLCFDLLNDKKSKIYGTKGSKKDEEED